MSIFALALLVVFSAAGAWLGEWVAGLKLSRGLPVCLGALALVAARAMTAHVPGVEDAFYLWDHYPYFKAAIFAPPALLVLAFLARRVPRRPLRVLLGLFAVVVFSQAALYSLHFVWAEHWYSALSGTVDETGYCPQTSPYTCGAASAAMLLHSAGINTTEAEMARECLVRAGIGVTDNTLARGIRRKTEGTPWRIKVIKNLRYDQLRELPKPALISLRQSWLLQHIVVVEWTEDRRVGIADPQTGRTVMPREQFERSWVGDALTLVRAKGPNDAKRGETLHF